MSVYKRKRIDMIDIRTPAQKLENAKHLEMLLNRKSYIILACITYEKMILFQAYLQNIRLEQDLVVEHLFSPTACVSCEEEEVKALIDTWPSRGPRPKVRRKDISLSENMVIVWALYMAMETWARGQRGNLSTEKHDCKVSLMHREDARGLIKEGHCKVGSVDIDLQKRDAPVVLDIVEDGCSDA
jgi:hypothetical protein